MSVNRPQPNGDAPLGPGSARAEAATPPAPPDPLRATVARMALGDENALSALYEATSPLVFGLVLRILRDRSSCEEVVIEVYAQAWKQARRYDPAKGGVVTWLGVMARTRAIDLLRARSRFQAQESELLDDHAQADPAGDPLESFSRLESAANVRGALAALPHEQRRLIEAAFFRGMSHSEIAGALGQPLGTVKTRIRMGLLALRRALAPLEEELA